MQEQSFRGVSISFSPDNRNLPEEDYVQLLHALSLSRPRQHIHFASRVGIAKVALTGGLLGLVMGMSLSLLLFADLSAWMVKLCAYLVLLGTYHWAEFLVTCYNHPQTATFDSFLINQSKQYMIALVASWIEFAIEALFVPGLKTDYFITSLVGLSLVLIGQTIRTTAMLQAGPSFTHLIVSEKFERHELISHGLYRYLRHPGYFGWFYWSIGTQLLLCNPICVVLYFLAAQSFFRNRIPYEEEELRAMYDAEYDLYCQRTWIGIPGI